ncbi:uncharacterized protein (DUF305 family) [Glaciihabitans tibetensis]|uniref:Uncharacterized protein (DUF305 family) n=1 Tax=Glaciihabitans tibetensis TaxID=1266600 RepID=A0A2T0V720_9MICO|nr:DUF305 domain-containing protein [Glaciihabitans tibetensis]PRY65970.1 uncharacterized protein (DUF305 family) [Glaciihabitans tibetensis]
MEPNRTRRIIAVALVGLFVLAGVFAAGRLTAPRVGTPSNVSAEAGFARDMQTHHNQAVEMSFIIRDLTDDPEVRLVAYDIATSQASQGGQLYGYLTEWNLPQAEPEPSMTWMTRATLAGETHGHNGAGPDAAAAHTPGDPMPGLATAEQMAELKTLTGVEAERYFLTLMIEHHKGGLVMAEALLERSDYRPIVALARGVVTVQTTEISVMEAMLAARQ